MNHTIIRAMIVCTALVSGAAFADGVPLITPGPAVPLLKGQAEDASVPGFVKHHFITLNKNAFQAKVVTVTIDGKAYRFVGELSPMPAKLSASQVQQGLSDSRTWGGTTGTLGQSDYGTMAVTINPKGGLYGHISLPPSRRFTIYGNGVMTEEDVNKRTPTTVREVQPIPPAASGAMK